jgi:Mn2+/Fe2+ NRAMP family transporter
VTSRIAEKQPECTEPEVPKGKSRGGLRALGLGLITGAADDDCSAIGTYASAGAKFGPGMLCR